MGILKLATNQSAYLKMGIFGFQGSGKSFTASLVAIGLHKWIGSKKPVAYYDTETGSDFLLPTFQKNGIELLTVKSRSLQDLATTIREAEESSDILIVDSITHPWREFLEAYKKKNRLPFIRIQDWGRIKPEWADKYSTPYVNSKLHIIMCGRAGNIFEDVEDDDDNGGSKKKWKAVKTGTKMAGETETGYEPSMLVELERVFKEGRGKYARRATVVKDRFNVIDGKEFENPVFKDFLPHVKLLNIGGEHIGVDATRNSEEMFDNSGDIEWSRKRKDKKIVLEEMEGVLVKHFPGSSAKEKKFKLDLIEHVFQTRSWTKIESLGIEALREGLASFRDLLSVYQGEGDFEALLKSYKDKPKVAEETEEDVPFGIEENPEKKEETLDNLLDKISGLASKNGLDQEKYLAYSYKEYGCRQGALIPEQLQEQVNILESLSDPQQKSLFLKTIGQKNDKSKENERMIKCPDRPGDEVKESWCNSQACRVGCLEFDEENLKEVTL